MHSNARRNCIAQKAAKMAVVVAVAAVLVGCGRGAPGAAPKPPEGAPTAAPQKAQTPAEGKPAGQPAPPKQDTVPDLRAIGKSVTLRWIEKGKTSMNAKARRFEGNEVTRTGILLDFSAELYENGKLTTTMTAPKVIADEANRTLTATGGVTLESLDRGTVVKSEWIRWFSRDDRIVGNGGVKAVSNMGTGDRYEMEGAAFEADTALKTLTIRDSAKALVNK